MRVRALLREAKSDLSHLLNFHRTLLVKENPPFEGDDLVEMEALTNKAITQTQVRVRQLEDRISWSIHHSKAVKPRR